MKNRDAVDADNFSILGHTLTDQRSDDTFQVSLQLDQIDTSTPARRGSVTVTGR